MTTTCEKCGREIPTLEPALLSDGLVLCRSCNAEADPTCPHCGESTGRAIPKAGGMCKACGNRFRVDREQWLFASVLLTEAQASQLGDLRRVYRRAARAGVTEEAFRCCCLASMRSPSPAQDATERVLRAAIKRGSVIESAVSDQDRLAIAAHEAHRLAQAAQYALHQWETLVAFAADGAVPIDNK